MIFTAGMKKVDLLIFKKDIDTVLEYLGKSRCFQVADIIEGEMSGNHKKIDELYRKLKTGIDFLGYSPGETADSDIHVPGDEDFMNAEQLLEKVHSLTDREKALSERKLKIQNILDEVNIFRNLDLPVKEIEAVTYLSCRIGRVDPSVIQVLRDTLESRALIIELDINGRIFAVSSKKGRFALDTELNKAGFREIPITQESRDFPPEVLSALEEECGQVEESLRKVLEEKGVAGLRYGPKIGKLLDIMSAGIKTEEIKDHLESTETVFKLSGWVASSDSKKIIADLEAITVDRIAIRFYDAEEVESVRLGTEKVPVRLDHGKFMRSFSSIVISYGAPLYGTIDPTFLVSVFFVILFAIMFGDVGQGFVGVLAGIILERDRFPGLRRFRKFAPIFKTVGAACMITGFLYGSFFASEDALVPLTRFLTGSLLGRPMDRFISLAPSHGIGKIMIFFGFTIGVGIVINSIGLLVNIYNRFKLKDYRRAVFSKTGIIGSFLFWYSLVLAVRLRLGSRFSGVDVFFLLSPLVLLFWGEPLYRLMSGERPLFPEGFFSFFMEGFVEVMETVSYFISNSVSFLRVGAFALSHTVLSLIVFQIAGLVSSFPGGIFFQAMVIVAGNVLIIVLEGLIVSIQVIRLQYYEFFSKFFTESGTAFKPFEFSAPRL